MKNYNLDEIAEWAIGDNQYSREEILNLPGYYLVVEIRSNHPSVLKCERLPNGQMEQRQFSMFRMIENLCSKHQIPDLYFNLNHGELSGQYRLEDSSLDLGISSITMHRSLLCIQKGKKITR